MCLAASAHTVTCGCGRRRRASTTRSIGWPRHESLRGLVTDPLLLWPLEIVKDSAMMQHKASVVPRWMLRALTVTPWAFALRCFMSLRSCGSLISCHFIYAHKYSHQGRQITGEERVISFLYCQTSRGPRVLLTSFFLADKTDASQISYRLVSRLVRSNLGISSSQI